MPSSADPRYISPFQPDQKAVTFQGHGDPLKVDDLERPIPDSQKWNINRSPNYSDQFTVQSVVPSRHGNFVNPSDANGVIAGRPLFEWEIHDAGSGTFVIFDPHTHLAWTAGEDNEIFLAYNTGGDNQKWFVNDPKK